MSTERGDLALSSMMGGFGFQKGTEHLDLKHLSAEDASEYLWRRFAAWLDR